MSRMESFKKFAASSALLLAVSLLTWGCGVSSSETPATTTTTSASSTTSTSVTSTTNASIYFQSARSPWALYKISQDGITSEIVVASTGGVSLEEPAVSPDGQKIAYSRLISGVRQVCLANIDGTSEEVMTTSGSAHANHDPAWWPDGSKLIICRTNAYGAGDAIITVNVNNIDDIIYRKTELQGLGYASYFDAVYLTYFASNGNKMRIYKVNNENSDNVTDLGSIEADPAGNYDFYTPRVSPDGTKIAFASTVSSESLPLREIMVMNSDGTGVRRLTSRTAGHYDNYRPSWSPDGAWVAFYSNLQGDVTGETYDIYKVHINGTGETNVTNNSFPDINPNWD